MLGYAGKMLRIDLTTRQHIIENLPEKMALDYIGGRGFMAKIFWDKAIRVRPHLVVSDSEIQHGVNIMKKILQSF